jgi:RNA polymerase sigma-70 factor (ECF subfamily)
MLGSPDTAEGLVEDVFVVLWRQRETLEVRNAVTTYLFSVARNRALNVLRHERVERRWRETEGAALRDEPSTPFAAPDDALDAEQVRAAVRRAIDGLSPQRRQVLLLRWEQGLSYAEIAEVVGSSVVAVERQLSRTLKALRLALPAWLTADDRPTP